MKMMKIHLKEETPANVTVKEKEEDTGRTDDQNVP